MKMLFKYFILISCLLNFCYSTSLSMQRDDDSLQTIDKPAKFVDNEIYYVVLNEANTIDDTKVDVKLYYECLCPDCMQFYKNHFAPVVKRLSQYLNIQTYPYGNAKTIVKDGNVDFLCQHGPLECYGNKLHACAIDHLQNITQAVIFNACMIDLENTGSDDNAADKCASELQLESQPIKDCAKGPRGTKLLQQYGEESKKADFKFVPYILINGKLNDGENFMRDVCSEFASPPPPCNSFIALLTVKSATNK